MSDSVLEPSVKLSNADVFQNRKEELGLDIGWFKQIQEDAWSKYQELPMPSRRDEKWRFSHLNRIRELDSFEPAPFEAVDDERIVQSSRRFNDVAGRIIFIDDNVAAPREVDPEVEAQGVIFTTLIDAIARHPDLVRQYFMQQSPELGSEKFEALHLAMLRNGVFLHIPDNVEIAKPFVVYNWAKRENAALFPHTLFVTGEHAKGSLVEFQESASTVSKNLIIANSHLFAGNGAQPNHTIVQNWNLKSLSFQLNTSNAERDTNTKSTMINLGSQQARQEIHGRIFGSGSNVELYALNVPKGTQEFDQRTLQTHIAANSRSDLLFKNALMDESRTIFSGLIIVEENAQQTDAYQTNNNLMLSESAESNALPGLEIKANDVKCSHGATTGRIDESELFYFLSRGITRKKAQELMVFGYFEEIVSKLDNPELTEYVRELVQKKFTD